MRRVQWLVLALCVSTCCSASQFSEALEAGDKGVTFMEAALSGLYQNALNTDEDTGSYEIDLIGSFLLSKRDEGQIGDTDFVFWLFSVDNLGDLQSTGAMRMKAGLLWDTNDINVDSNVTQFGVLGIRQFFLDDRMELGFGKMFPGMIHTESAYTANNSETFTSKIVSSSAVGGYFEAIGLGANIRYQGKDWFVQAGFSDAKSESEIDFDSLIDGVLASTLEVGWSPRISNGETSVSLLGFRVDETPTLSRQTGLALAATHDFGDTGRYGVFGRYTWADGGKGMTEQDQASALPLKSGGFVGLAWNRPFDRNEDQVGLVALYGRPTSYRRSLGFKDQYGIEAYYRFPIGRLFRILPSLQLLRNQNRETEWVVGLRMKISEDFAKYFAQR